MLNIFRRKVVINEERLSKKLKMAEKILAYEMPARKEGAYLAFIKGMVELTKKEERIFDKRLAEMKELRKKPAEMEPSFAKSSSDRANRQRHDVVGGHGLFLKEWLSVLYVD